MPLTFAQTPLYYRDAQGNYHRILSGADMTGYRTAAAQDAITAELVAEIKPIMPTQPIAIPASGTTVAYDIDGITAYHRLVQWNFADNGAALPENSPPVALEWATYDGYFTITNDGGTTAATIQPLFVLPSARAATTHTT